VTSLAKIIGAITSALFNKLVIINSIVRFSVIGGSGYM
jgi:hypothetical protein